MAGYPVLFGHDVRDGGGEISRPLKYAVFEAYG